ncbi:phage holin family protein [Candidatus Peregrinibacteria bacterium]|nr:phage holin family protein [Candidatus Peregrinibacteria bacterium]MBT7483747.1 phage holin family protein [Candidatus Peregrinibacteria bacterium]MBT7703812.1 phage holin family protein [Candidatus Peregrinibacteria bacterium]
MKRTLKKIGFSLAFNIGALYLTISLLEEISFTGGWAFFVVTGVLIGLLNVILKPILKFVSMPLIFFSAGFFLIVINAAILWIADQLLAILDFTNIDFVISGALNFLLAAIIFGLINWFEHWLFKRLK